jgi:catechol 2,3-dioxygenase-like lactoylglutathione lyase family enzyme
MINSGLRVVKAIRNPIFDIAAGSFILFPSPKASGKVGLGPFRVPHGRREKMSNTEPRGVVHWIDHFVVGTNDMSAWVEWAISVTGIQRQPIAMLTTQARKKNLPIFCFLPFSSGSCRFGAFLQSEIYPKNKGLSRDMPRYGFFIQSSDIDEHLNRLERLNVQHSDPVPVSSEGVNGTAIYFEDPDGNQYEFWAPSEMPDGAMEVSTRLKVGRISHAVYGSRDLERTAAFFKEYCGLGQLDSPEIPEDTLVLRTLGGARIIYKRVDEMDERVAGHMPWWDMHMALTVRHDELLANYRRMWDGLPEEQDTKEKLGLPRHEENALPARTALHPSPAGVKWRQIYKRGDDFFDWDGHLFHFYGGIPLMEDGSLAVYRAKDQEEYLKELSEAVEQGTLR